MATGRELVSGSKICTSCKNELPKSSFHKSSNTKDGLCFKCKECTNYNNRQSHLRNKEGNNKRKREWRKNNPEKFRNAALKSKFDISLDVYNSILESQNNSCAICKRDKLEFNYHLAVDHCHKTGEIRGLLCRNCNAALGHFKDNLDTIKNSIVYLEKFINNVN